MERDPKKLILSFLGTGNYQEVPYTLDGKAYRTPYTQEALALHFPEHTLKVLLTQAARDKHGEALAARVPYEPIPIPDGRTAEELWEIFRAIVEAVPPGASLVMDISHGFRSQPVLALAVLHFLGVAKDVRVERVVYGALREDGLGEFLDLTPFLELLAWTQAVSDLKRYGFGKPLAELLNSLHRATWQAEGKGARKLAPLGNTLESLSTSLELLRLQEASEHARHLLSGLEEVREDLERFPSSRPLKAFLESLRERYQGIATEDLFTRGGLEAQANMVELLLSTGSLAQALALMREMMVTWVCLQQNLDPLEERQVGEAFLGSWQKRAQRGSTDQKAHLGTLWNDLTNARNDVAHASMRPNPTPAETLARNIHGLWRELKELLLKT
ncbi:TIGR02221 family CRISPR-associated protein [Thermus brockianus]|uniref:CRISPR-associated (Cas) DxTHG family protein n=1 Tax=Thermus brockianus TaxID=56956 RepID=A0ABN6NLD0_THEBO|nr:TIGR02221 family CRISPR-associated protein [Thermus brockianus]BDG17588.1 hypothetical protein TbrSNM41_23220 [Thermus brockianus]